MKRLNESKERIESDAELDLVTGGTNRDDDTELSLLLKTQTVKYPHDQVADNTKKDSDTNQLSLLKIQAAKFSR